MKKISKAYEIRDARISFVSLVDKAANKRGFLIVKAEDGRATFQSTGRILKVDTVDNCRHITGVVYEPMAEDSDGNYMTEDEITKAAYWYAKNGDKVDLQHSFEELPGAAVVETWVSKSDQTIGDQDVRKGSWLMTIEVNDAEVIEKVDSGEITGFSMGGMGMYSAENVDLDTVVKEETIKQSIVEKAIAAIKNAFGVGSVEKGAFNDNFHESAKSNLFWLAFNTLEDTLSRWNWYSDRREYESDETAIRAALEEFSTALTSILAESNVAKALAPSPGTKTIAKAGLQVSAAHRQKLEDIHKSLGDFLSGITTESEEENEVTKAELVKTLEETLPGILEKAMDAAQSVAELAQPEPQQQEAQLTKDEVAAIVEETVTKTLSGKGFPSNLNGETDIQKSQEDHYLKGIL